MFLFNMNNNMFVEFLRGKDKKIILFFLFFIFHYRLYYLIGISCYFLVEFILVVISLVLIKYHMKITGVFSKKDLISYAFGIMMFGSGCYVLGYFIIENKLLYKSAEEKYGFVYSSKLISLSHSNKIGYTCYVRLQKDTLKKIHITSCSAKPNENILFSYPKLAYEEKKGFFSIYHKRLFENNPTDIQLEYCKDGARISEKINSLKKYSGVVLENELLDYMTHINQHDNRMISAVVERRGEKYLFANVLQSDDKLWAFKYRDVEEGKKVLIIYDISSPHLFYVIDWNPSDEDYEYYNTKEGQKPTFKYLLKLERLSKSLQAKNDEERVDD